MRFVHFALASLLFLSGCFGEPTPEQEPGSLVDARAGFKTTLVPNGFSRTPAPDPPPELFRKVYYDSPVGKLAAYLSQAAEDGQKRPAIIWITGGDCNSIGDVWSEMPLSNEQTASAYRKAGLVMMFPALRGGNDSPVLKEAYLGEVDDVLAAYEYLARQEPVDPTRIYLGGHSTGGTVALLVAECSDKFRAVFSFGPSCDVSRYPPGYTPFDTSSRREVKLRSPGYWLGSIRTPTFIFEGTGGGNLAALEAMSRATKNPMVHFFPVRNADHLTVLGPTNSLIGRKILRDDGKTTNLAFSEDELNQPFAP
jgi:hypothetical protein